MSTISVGELRQNPTRMLELVQEGASFTVTRHGQEIARIVPPEPLSALIPPKSSGPSRILSLGPVEPGGGATVDEVAEEMKGDW